MYILRKYYGTFLDKSYIEGIYFQTILILNWIKTKITNINYNMKIIYNI